MRVVRFHEIGGPEILQIEDLPEEAPGPGQVGVRIEAIGLNQAEALFRRGFYFQQPQLPSRIGYEATGVVGTVGDGVGDLKVGDAVNILPFLEMTRFGVYAEYAVVPASAVIRRPEELSPIDAAAIWMPAFTATLALTRALGRQFTADDVLLITAAASSVGLAAIRLATREFGCNTVLAATRDEDKSAALAAAGAIPVVAKDGPALVKAVAAASPKPPTVIIDAVGGPGLAALAEVAASHATLLLCGALGGADATLPVAATIGKARTVRGYSIGEAAPGTEAFADIVARVRKGIGERSVVAGIDGVLPLDRVVEAHQRLESGRQTGKIVLSVEGHGG